MCAAVVVDNGSGFIKAGFAGETAPKAVFPSVVGRPRFQPGSTQVYVGNDALARRSILRLNRPINLGNVSNWDDLEILWNHTFSNELRISAQEHPVLMTEAHITQPLQREKIAQIMFEKFNVPSLCLASQAEMALHASGRSTGIVVDSGYSLSSIVPFSDGTAMPQAATSLAFAGQSLTTYLQLLLKQGSLETTLDVEILRDVKEKSCYVALDFDKEMQTAASSTSVQTTYELPDGQVVTLNNERFQCPEALFQPEQMNTFSEGIHEVTHNSLTQADAAIRSQLYANVILAGGSTMFPGFAERMQKEIGALAPAGTNVNIIAKPERKYMAWIGGAMVASLSTFSQKSISRQEYQENGPSIVNTKL